MPLEDALLNKLLSRHLRHVASRRVVQRIICQRNSRAVSLQESLIIYKFFKKLLFFLSPPTVLF